MKKLLTFLLILLAVDCFPVWTYGITMQTDWFRPTNLENGFAQGYFSGKKNFGEFEIRVKASQNSIIQPFIFVMTLNGNIAIPIDGINKNGFTIAKIKHYELEKIKSIQTIISIDIWTKNGLISMPVGNKLRNELLELITYTKPL